ncbi:3,9-dihydroxypterocarpan 6A-monooxygenase [Linum perenne]
MFSDINILDITSHYSLPIILALSIAFLIHKCLESGIESRPPSPPALPIIGHLHLIGSSFPKSFQTLARRYGPLIRVRLGSDAYLIASSATVAKEILKTNDACFLSKFESGPTHFNIYRGTGFITGPYGDYWRFMRKLCVTGLFSGSQFEQFNHIRERELTRLVNSLTRLSEEGRECDLNVELETLTNNVVCRMVMRRRFGRGDEGDEGCKEMRRMVSEIMDIAGKFGVNGLFGVLKKVDLFGYGKMLQDALWRYDGVMEEIMKSYEKKSAKGGCEEKDVMDILMETYEDENAEVKLTRTQIKHFIIESLRLHTAAPMIPRECTQDCEVNGFQVKVNTRVLVNAYAIMRDPDTWRDPDKFEPERFLLEEDCRGDGFGFEFVAFGGGRRGCVGSRHVDVVINTTVAALVQRFDWRVRDGEKIDISVALGFTGAMTPPLLCYPTARFHPF